MTDANDSTTVELHRMVADDPAPAGTPDVAALIHSGRRRLARRRAVLGGTAIAAAAAIAVPALLVGGGSGPTAVEDDPVSGSSPATARTSPRPTTIDGVQCGVISCINPAEASIEHGDVVGHPLAVGSVPGGAEELVYVINTNGIDLTTNQHGEIDVLKAGYRLDGRLYSTVWALQPGYHGPGANPLRFWSNPGLLAARDGSGDHYVVVGYVDGTPDKITWSTPDGRSGAVNGMQAVDGYTIFYLTQPLPDDYEPEGLVTNKEGVVEKTTPGSGFSPDLTIQTSDGWSCTLADCGTMG